VFSGNGERRPGNLARRGEGGRRTLPEAKAAAAGARRLLPPPEPVLRPKRRRGEGGRRTLPEAKAAAAGARRLLPPPEPVLHVRRVRCKHRTRLSRLREFRQPPRRVPATGPRRPRAPLWP
jgi:hypothetical protein